MADLGGWICQKRSQNKGCELRVKINVGSRIAYRQAPVKKIIAHGTYLGRSINRSKIAKRLGVIYGQIW